MSKVQSFYPFIKNNTWVDIPQFFKYIRNQPKGFVYKTCQDVAKIFNADWIDTWYKNSTFDFVKMRELFKKLNINNDMPKIDKQHRRDKFAGVSRHRAVAQSLDDVFTFPKRVNSIVNETLNTLPQLQQAAGALQNTAGDLSSMLSSIQEFVDECKNKLTVFYSSLTNKLMDLLTVVLKLLAAAFLLQQEANQNLPNVVAILTLIMPSSVASCIQSFAIGLIRVIQGMSGVAAQSEEDDGSFISSFFTLTVGIVKGLFTEVPKEVYDSLYISTKKVKLIADYIRGVTTIGEFLLKLFAKLMELIGDKILKYYNILPSFVKEDALTPLIDEFMHIKLNRLDESCTINKEDARRVVSLYEKLLGFEAKMNKQNRGRFDIKISPYIRIMIKVLEGSISRMPEHLRSGMIPRRIKPYWCYIYGDPRIGKSAVVQPYIVSVLAQAMGTIKTYEDYTNYTYLRNCGEDYWEGYNNHPVLWYNDLFQNYAQDEAMHKAVLELTNIVDDNVYPLNMAFERKHCVYFNSDIVISNAQNEILNANFITDKCWSGGKHLYARRNICVHVAVHPKYAKGRGTDTEPGIDYVVMANEMRLNPQNCVGYDLCTLHTPEEYAEKLQFPSDLYQLTFTDPMTGYQTLQTNFIDGMRYIATDAQVYRATQGRFKDKLYKHFEESFNARQFANPILAQADEEPYRSQTYIFDSPFEEQPDVNEEYHDAPGFNDNDRIAFVQAQIEDALRTIERTLPGLIGAQDFRRISAARTNLDNDALEVIYMWYARGATDNEDTFARVSLALELIGEQAWSRQNLTWWQKFKLNANAAWITMRNFFRATLEQLPFILGLVHTCAMIYAFYQFSRLISGVIFSWWVAYKRNSKCQLCTLSPHFETWNLRRQGATDKECLAAEMELNRQEAEQIRSQNEIRAQTAEGKTLPPKPVVRRIRKDVTIQAQSYDPQNAIVENIISKQMCKWRLTILKDDVPLQNQTFGSGLCVGSDIFVLPAHFWLRWQEMRQYYTEKGLIVQLSLLWNESLEQIIDWNSISTYRLPFEHSVDIIFIRIQNLVQKTHLKKFFIRTTDEPVLYEMYLYGYRSVNFCKGMVSAHSGEITSIEYDHKSPPDALFGKEWEARNIAVPSCVTYHGCITNGGDCGMMVMHCDSRLNCRKILAMHTAGCVTEQYGVGNLIYQEDIEEVFTHFYPQGDSIKPQAQEFSPCDNMYATKLESMGFTVLGELPRLVVPEYNIDKKTMLTLPRKSKISKSVVYDIMEKDFGPSSVAPARLRPFEKDGEMISPFYKAMTKLVRASPMPDAQIATQVQQHMFESIMQWTSVYSPRVLTDYEAVNGVGVLNPIEMNTSPGYPYVAIDNTNGKLPFFKVIQDNPKIFEMGPYLHKEYTEREELARQGIMKTTFFIDTLKDETRPLPKVAEGKTRLFQVAPMDFNILMRKYFGAFICHAQSCYITGEGAVGINANSEEWTLLVKYLNQIGDSLINGDGENYDASAGQPMAMRGLEAINQWYRLGTDWQPHHDTIRRVLWATVLNSLHIHRNIVYILVQGNKSGIIMTTWFNILTGMFCIRYAFVKYGYELRIFHKYVRPKFYGDDDLIVLNAHVIKITTKDYAKILKTLGIVYTSATKGELIDGWYKISEVSFLKRRFVWDGMRYLPQLDFNSIVEIPRWSESDPMNGEDQLNRFNSCLLELSNYGRDAFSKFRNHFVEYIYLMRRLGINLRASSLFNFDYCERIKWGEQYTPIPLVDLAEESDVDSVVQLEGCRGEASLSTSNDIFGSSSLVVQRTANAQTHEGKQNVVKPQIIRCPKPVAQSDDDVDFNLYLVMIDYLKELEPCMTAFSRALQRSVDVKYVSTNYSVLHRKVKLLLKIFNGCREVLESPKPIHRVDNNLQTIIEQPKFEAQSNEQPTALTGIQQQAGITHAPSQVTGEGAAHNEVEKVVMTTFVDENTPHQPPVLHTTVPKPDNWNVSLYHDSFFETPFLIDQIEWKSTQTQWSSMGSWNFPSAWLALDPIKTKMAMIMYMRPDFEIEIVCNATKFHYGRIMFVVAPFANGASTLPDCYLKPYNASTWPHWYQLSAGAGQSVKFVVPYRHFFSQINVQDTSDLHRKMFTIYSWVTAPLQSANGVASSVEISIFARLSKTNFAGRIYSGAVAQSNEQQNLSSQGLTTMTPIGNSSARVASTALAGVSKVTSDLAHLAYSAGFSVPTNTAHTSSMQIRQPLLNKCEDNPNSIVLGPSQSVGVIKSREYVNSEEDDMNINYICAHPSLLYSYKLTEGTTVGTILWSTAINPLRMSFGATDFTNPSGAFYPLPMGYLARYFRLWRGSMKFHFSAITSAFHSCRIRIFYIPDGSNTESLIANPTLQTGSFLRNVVWDINANADITVEVPFECPTHWRNVNKVFGNTSGGHIGIQLINKLSSVAVKDSINPIHIQVFVSAGDDFQFAHATNLASTGTAITTGGLDKWAPDIKETVTLMAQSGEGVDACQIPASSSTCLRNQTGILMGDICNRSRKYRDSVSFGYTSVKQLINQLTPIERFSSTTTDTSVITGRAYTPYGEGWETRGFDDAFWISPLHTIIPLFRFMRGGFRVHVLTNDKVQATAWLSYDAPTSTLTAIPCYESSKLDFMNGLSSETTSSLATLRQATYGAAFIYDNSVFPIDVTAPYNATIPCRLTLQGYYSTGGPVERINIGLSTQKAAKTMIFCVAGADDLMLGYRMSIPRIRTAAKPALAILDPTISIPEDKQLFAAVGNAFYRYEPKTKTWHSANVKATHLDYVYEPVKDIGTFWTRVDRVHPAIIDPQIREVLNILAVDKPRQRPKRSLVEKIMGGQISDFTESD